VEGVLADLSDGYSVRKLDGSAFGSGRTCICVPIHMCWMFLLLVCDPAVGWCAGTYKRVAHTKVPPQPRVF
jgi:hypothetical protein